MWVFLQSDEVDINDTAQMMMHHMVQLGLKCPSEPTYQACAGLLLACHSGLSKANGLPPSEKHSWHKFCKATFKKVSKQVVQTTYIQELPQSVLEFQSKFGSVFDIVFSATEPPAPCPVDLVNLTRLTESIPQRNTHKDISPVSSSLCVSGPTRPAHDMTLMMQQMWSMMLQSQQASPGRVPITILKPPGGNRAMGSSDNLGLQMLSAEPAGVATEAAAAATAAVAAVGVFLTPAADFI